MLLLEAQELYRFFHNDDEEVKALRGVTFTLAQGEFVALMGPSGSGKSTLLACLAGLDEPDGGMVHLLSLPVSRRPEAEKTKLRAAHIGALLQKTNLISHLNVLENVQLAQKMSVTQSPVPAEELVSRVGLKQRAESLPAALSGGERARAGLAVALANRPRILLLDEPTGEVDAATEASILALLSGLTAEGVGIVVATHNPAVANAAKRVVKMRDGKVLDV
ncbi:MAG: ABC transporter ATP-binding protein [Alphaproteobacteria bacterium]|nr:ABC transporter ATP-binding protein [Alphaproteobacteria bacterium]